MTFEDYKTGRNVSRPLVISLKYENKVTVKKFPFMKVQNSANLSYILDGDFVGGEMVWWRGDQDRAATLPGSHLGFKCIESRLGMSNNSI